MDNGEYACTANLIKIKLYPTQLLVKFYSTQNPGSWLLALKSPFSANLLIALPPIG
jgi:hypothetical protein